MTYKLNLNWYLFELCKKEHDGMDETTVKEFHYPFELTEFEFNVLWAYEIDQAINRLENLSKSMVDDLRFDPKTKWMFKFIESWRSCFKYIIDYQKHLDDVIYNCSIYHGISEKSDEKPFEYENSWLVNFRDDMYRRLTGSKETTPERKRKHSSLISG